MKMRYFLRGLGVGVLLATLLLCISYRGQNSENSIIKQAKELGMQFPEKTPYTLSSYENTGFYGCTESNKRAKRNTETKWENTFFYSAERSFVKFCFP